LVLLCTVPLLLGRILLQARRGAYRVVPVEAA
jgi:hypothetical protein